MLLSTVWTPRSENASFSLFSIKSVLSVTSTEARPNKEGKNVPDQDEKLFPYKW